jgi:hypothetical protein
VIAGWSDRTVMLLYLGLAILWVAVAPASGLAVVVLPTLCAFLLWRGVVVVERRADQQEVHGNLR